MGLSIRTKKLKKKIRLFRMLHNIGYVWVSEDEKLYKNKPKNFMGKDLFPKNLQMAKGFILINKNMMFNDAYPLLAEKIRLFRTLHGIKTVFVSDDDKLFKDPNNLPKKFTGWEIIYWCKDDLQDLFMHPHLKKSDIGTIRESWRIVNGETIW